MTLYEQRRSQLHAIAGTLAARERRLILAPWHTLTEMEKAEALELSQRLGELMARREAKGRLRRVGHQRS
jgi:hypothetical protein